MRELRRTFHVGPRGDTRPIVMSSTTPGFWRTPIGILFQHHGHVWLSLT